MYWLFFVFFLQFLTSLVKNQEIFFYLQNFIFTICSLHIFGLVKINLFYSFCDHINFTARWHIPGTKLASGRWFSKVKSNCMFYTKKHSHYMITGTNQTCYTRAIIDFTFSTGISVSFSIKAHTS